MWKWIAHATYTDGHEIYREFPYTENDSYTAEEDRQYELECMLVCAHEGLDWMSVVVVDD